MENGKPQIESRQITEIRFVELAFHKHLNICVEKTNI